MPFGLTPGVPRLPEGSGELLLSGPDAGCGLQLRPAPGGHPTGVRPADPLQLPGDLRGSGRCQARPRHLRAGAAEVRCGGVQHRPHRGPLPDGLPQLPLPGNPRLSAGPPEQVHKLGHPLGAPHRLAG